MLNWKGWCFYKQENLLFNTPIGIVFGGVLSCNEPCVPSPIAQASEYGHFLEDMWRTQLECANNNDYYHHYPQKSIELFFKSMIL